MASTSEGTQNRFCFERLNNFPCVINGRINIKEFLIAATDLVTIVDRLGKVFTPVKYDMQGNIDKIKKFYEYNENTCLLELILEETSNGNYMVAEGILWLNRAMLFFELVFQQVLGCLQSKNYDVGMKKIFSIAYEGSVKRHHNWVTQQIFVFICKMSPTLPQIFKSLQVDNDLAEFETRLTNFNITLHLVRCKIDDFFKDNNLFNDIK